MDEVPLHSLADEAVISHILKENLQEFSQWRLTVNEFKGEQYFSIREYFLDFEGEWKPTKKGMTVPLELVFTLNLFNGLKRILAEAEQL
jgi:hypothetical protein